MTNFYKNKNILIAGGTGMIGSFLSEKLLRLGANIKIVAKDNKFNLLNVFMKIYAIRYKIVEIRKY